MGEKIQNIISHGHWTTGETLAQHDLLIFESTIKTLAASHQSS